MNAALVHIENLTVEFPTARGELKAVDRLSLRMDAGESVGLVGESGCGKTTTALSILRLLPRPGRVESGRILFQGKDLLTLRESEMREIRGRKIGMVFQEPLRSMNPVERCGEQVAETLHAHLRLSSEASRRRVLALFEQVGLSEAARVYEAYPHQISGGMRQRVMMAMALACDPPLLLADEPTTALDVTIQAQIVGLLARLKQATNLAVLFISHNLALVSGTCERVAVMYAGRLVEVAPTDALFERSRHPYTRALIASLPRIDGPLARSIPIPGEVPDLLSLPPGCRFGDRCPEARRECRLEDPPLVELSAGHSVACWRANGRRGESVS